MFIMKKSINQQFNLLRIGNNKEYPSFFYYELGKYSQDFL